MADKMKNNYLKQMPPGGLSRGRVSCSRVRGCPRNVTSRDSSNKSLVVLTTMSFSPPCLKFSTEEILDAVQTRADEESIAESIILLRSTKLLDRCTSSRWSKPALSHLTEEASKTTNLMKLRDFSPIFAHTIRVIMFFTDKLRVPGLAVFEGS